MNFFGFLKSKKRSFFPTNSYLQVSALTGVTIKVLTSSKQDNVKGVPFVNRGTFSVKNSI